MKFRHAFISLGVSHVVAMAPSYPPSAKVASANNVVYNPCGRKRFAHEHSPRQQGALPMSSISDLTPGIWNVDPVHSSIGFVARHLMVSKVRGRFGTFTGTLTIAEDPLKSKVEATADITSLSTGDESRDGHLKSADFFNAE